MKALYKKKYIAKKVLTAWLWLILPLSMLAVFCLYPAATAIIQSFLKVEHGKSEFIFFGNFLAIFADPVFRKSLLNMLVLVVCGLLTGNIATLILAELLFNMRGKKTSKGFRYLFLLPSLVPGMVTILLWKNIMLSGGENGVFNMILGIFGLQPSAWYFSESLSKFSIIMTNFPWVGGISFLIYLAGLLAIPESCYEAAELDGITTLKRIFYIDLPLLVSQIKYFVIIGIIGGVQVFDIQLIITDGGPNYSTVVPGYLLYLKTYGYGALGEASAIGVVLFVITLITTQISSRLARKAQGGQF